MKPKLEDEPVSILVSREAKSGRLFLSDLPEQLFEALRKNLGDEAFNRLLERNSAEVRFHQSLPRAVAEEASFLALHRSGELSRRTTDASRLRPTPYFMCAINRGDEMSLGRTGVVYFACRKGCHFCQYRNLPEKTLDVEQLSQRFLLLQEHRADNVQWLSPTAYHRALIHALELAALQGFTTRILHKGEGEDSLADLELLDGVVDVYLPDAKFVSEKSAEKIGLSKDYGKRLREALKEMWRQVGALTVDSATDVACRGLMVRHLLMPDGLADLSDVIDLLVSIHADIPLHVMTGYTPTQEAMAHKALSRRLTPKEIQQAEQLLAQSGLRYCYVKT